MIGSLSLDQELTDCVVGQPKTLTLVVTPTRNDSGVFEATVDSLEDYEHAEETPEKPEGEMPMKGKGMMKGMAPAVAVVIGKGK